MPRLMHTAPPARSSNRRTGGAAAGRAIARVWLVAALLACGSCWVQVEEPLTDEQIADVHAVIAGAIGSMYEPSASFYVYICPDFNTGCNSSAFLINGTCVSHTGMVPGGCYDTGHPVAAGTAYSVQSCVSCPSDCGSPLNFTTPDALFADTYYVPAGWYCTTSCSPAALCP